MSTYSWKLEKDLCRCCHAEGSFLNLAEPCFVQGQPELYSTMLRRCFDINISSVPGVLCAVTYTICEACVLRLRDASNFKQQVQLCEERFRDMYTRNVIQYHNPAFDVKEELPDAYQEIDQTNLPQQQENRIENGIAKDLTSNKFVVVLEKHLKQIKTEATDVLQNLEVIKTDRSSHLTETHKEEPKEITSEFNSNPVFKKKGIKIINYKLQKLPSQPEHISQRTSAGVGNKRDSYRQTQLYSAEDLELCLNAVKSERLTAIAASVTYNIPISTIYRILDRDKDKPNITASSSALKHTSPCALCGQDISSSASLTQHECARAANTSSRDIEEQGEQTATKFTCDICKGDFKLKRSLYRHILHIHKYSSSSKILFTCQICDKQFSRSANLIVHQRTHTGDKPYSCKICNKQFSRSSRLISHQSGHSGDKPYSCKICNELFSDSSVRNRHQRVHTGEKSYSCNICNKQFSRSSHLISHQRIHSGDKPFLCEICNKQFSDSSHLIKHQRVHTGEKPYSCNICNKQFSDSSVRNRHQRIHTGEKPYSCNICNKQFSDSSDRIKHQRVHTGEKPYSCNICNKQFSRSSHLISHQSGHSGDKPYSCKICNKQFTDVSGRNKHQRAHTGDKPYSCNICNKKFSDSSHLITHQSSHSGDKPLA